VNITTLKAAAAYFALVFTLGFVLGALRVTVLVPRLGELMAVMVELPLMLTGAWFICRRVVRHFGVPAPAGPRLAMGGAAFALLMVAEFTLSVTAFGSTPGAFFSSLATPAGMLGLAGQAVFGLWPWAQGRGGAGFDSGQRPRGQ
jgi:hypothetical protein